MESDTGKRRDQKGEPDQFGVVPDNCAEKAVGDSSFLSRVFRGLNSAVEAVKEFALPLVCVACNNLLSAADFSLVCGRCWTRVQWLPYPRCTRCGHPTGQYSCRWCPFLPSYVRAVRSACWVPGGVGASIVYSLKYAGWPAVARGMATHMARMNWPVDVVSERAMLVPVPLALQRLRERGYNQSTILAHELAKFWMVPVGEVLARTRTTQTQTQLTAGERLQNVSGAFAVVVPEEKIAGKHLILVDDVVTTAATLNSCAAALFQSGARTISYVTFGRARIPGDGL